MRSKKFQMIDQAQISITQEATDHQFLVDLSKHLVKTGLYFMSKPNGRPCAYHENPVAYEYECSFRNDLTPYCLPRCDQGHIWKRVFVGLIQKKGFVGHRY